MLIHQQLDVLDRLLPVPPRLEISETDLDHLGLLKLAENAVKAHGAVVTLAFPRGGREMTLLARSDHVRFWQDNEDLFCKDSADAASGAGAMRRVLGATLQTAGPGDEWAAMRKEMTKLLGSTKAWFHRPLNDATRRLIADMQSPDAAPLNTLCLEWATRAICDPLFQNADLEPLSCELLDCLDLNFYQRMAATPSSQSDGEIAARIDTVMRKIAEDAGADSIAGAIFGSGRASGDMEETLRRIVAGLLAASLHMNGMTLFWALIHLADHPDIQCEIAQEGAGIGMEPRRVAQTPLAFAALREAQRLKPITAFLERQVTRPFELGGFMFETGQSVLFSPWLVHLDPANWQDPMRFDPMRFLGNQPIGRGTYFPFGVGMRVCPGTNIVNQQLTYALSTICQHLVMTRSTLTRPGDLRPLFKIVLEPRGAVRLHARRLP
jgi:cytochrome P450